MAPLAWLAAFTIIYGSVRALCQDDLKRRLAFSTISQVSYIVLGVAIVGPVASIGGVVHLVHQGLMKITLFFCAGNLAETLEIHKVSEMNGVGKRMPWTMAAFTIGALGMIGVPPIAGFVSKWYLGLGALDAGQDWIILVLIGSSLLNALYFLPILHRAWFREPPARWLADHQFGRKETAWALLLPPLVTAVSALGVGLLASMPFSPLDWAKLIVQREFYQP
jgi:multicomponent Na+:H+ antiporter subunit D